jgi:hypothetical protein
MTERLPEIDNNAGHGRAEVDEQAEVPGEIDALLGLLVHFPPATDGARTELRTESDPDHGPGTNGDGQADVVREIDVAQGLPISTPPNGGGQAEEDYVGDSTSGLPASFPEDEEEAVDETEIDARSGSLLASLSWSWRDIQQARLAAEQRGLTTLSESLLKVGTSLAEQVKRELRRQPIWPWLSQFPGLGGVHVARLVALIGDPHRFPGQPCTEGHIAPARFAVGDPCPRRSKPDADGAVAACAGTMLEPRRGTGTRSLWHYLGLHVVNGKSPRKAKLQKADWNPIGRTICLQPGGIAEQIVRHRVPVYREIYDAAKERLQRERGAVAAIEAAAWDGSALPEGPDAELRRGIGKAPGLRPIAIETQGAEPDREIEAPPGSLRPIQIEGIARKVAVKAFVGDLLTAWKALG